MFYEIFLCAIVMVSKKMHLRSGRERTQKPGTHLNFLFSTENEGFYMHVMVFLDFIAGLRQIKVMKQAHIKRNLQIKETFKRVPSIQVALYLVT